MIHRLKGKYYDNGKPITQQPYSHPLYNILLQYTALWFQPLCRLVCPLITVNQEKATSGKRVRESFFRLFWAMIWDLAVYNLLLNLS